MKAFTPLEFGLTINEPAQCKIDFNHTEKFEDMVSYMGGSNLYLYNHSESFRLHSAAALKNGSLIIENGEELTFFVRCRDKNGAEYAVNFCVDPTPVELYAKTLFGCNNGQAVCFWSDDGVDYIEFFDTNTEDGINYWIYLLLLS